MNITTKVFLSKKIKQYYWNTTVKAPKKVDKREFGFGTIEDKIKYRHKSMNTEKKLNDFLKREAPFYISYSSAYYEFPENQPMKTKNWMGADLIFDLDIDIDLLNKETMDEMKRQVIALTEFLEKDFGFSQKDIRINFSGSKGYHVHVQNDEIYSLNQSQRRMIVDYMTGTGLDINSHMQEISTQTGYVKSRGSTKIVSGEFIGPTNKSYGWGKKIYDAVYGFVSSNIDEMREIPGVGEKRASKIYNDREKNMKMIKEGHYDTVLDLTPHITDEVISKNAISIKDADKQVTLDTSRLIRLPDSIHGGSGLIAKITDDIDSFDPLIDAVAFSEEPTEIKTSVKIGEFELMGNTWGTYKKDQEIKIPEYVAIYLMVKNKCEKIK